MTEFTHERSHANAGIVKSALGVYQFASDMKELTQERSRTNAGIVKDVSAS